MENLLLVIWFFIVGSVIGSFLNVCIFRIPEGKSVIFPVYSFCPKCEKKILWRDNIPLLSFFLLRGKCRFCREKISARYPLVEFLSGAVTAVNFYIFGYSFYFLHITIFFYFLILLSFIDIEKGTLPIRISIIGVVWGILSGVFGRILSTYEILLGGILGGVIIIAVGLFGKLVFRKESMGGGDVLLAMMIGFFLGYKDVFISIWLAFLISFIFIIGYIIKTRKLRGRIKFGPFLSLGAFVCVFFGERLLSWYFRLL
ncbi:prepilin peptidase [candidate division KSB1 bacterium]|nr:MAG: prepilin peptidase [candidate division KSB1 bacterium]